jgi:hypothetical protein
MKWRLYAVKFVKSNQNEATPIFPLKKEQNTLVRTAQFHTSTSGSSGAGLLSDVSPAPFTMAAQGTVLWIGQVLVCSDIALEHM